jgi:hypothetical protein
LRVQLIGALVIAEREVKLWRLGLDLVFLQLRRRAFQRRTRRLEVRARLALAGAEILLVQFDEHRADLDDVVDVRVDALDDPVGFRLDLDLRDRLDLAGRDDRAGHRAALHGGHLRGVQGRGAIEGRVTPDAAHQCHHRAAHGER